MDDQIPNQENPPQHQAHTPADQDAQEFMQWMKEYGRPAMIGLAAVVIIMLGVSVWRNQQVEKDDAAVQALFQGRSPEEFQQLASIDPTAPTAPIALATAAAEFYAQNRYDEALASYQRFLGQYPDHMLVPDVTMGVAASLEALDEFNEAAESYMAFAVANPDHALQPQAVFGAARCREQLGQFDEARALYEEFIVAHPESTWLPQAESGLLFLNKAERAKDLPPPVAAPVVAVMGEVVSEPVLIETVETEVAAPAEEELKAAKEEPKKEKKKSSKKKKKSSKKKKSEKATAKDSASE
jgi:TolA-binding protein